MSLMDFLRGGPGNRSGASQANVKPQEPAPSERALADPEPLPKVAGPRYYTYKADSERLVKSAAFASSPLHGLADARVTAPNDIAAALEAYYAKAQAPLWVSQGDLNDKAKAVLALLAKADDYGLDPADYAVTPPALTTASVTPAATPAAADAGSTNAPATDVAAVTGSTTDAGAQPAAAAQPATTQPATAAQPDSAAPAQPATASAPNHEQALMQFELALSGKVMMFAQDMVRGRLDPNRISGYHDFKRKDVNLAQVINSAATEADASTYLAGLAPSGPDFLALKAELAKLKAEAVDSGDQVALPDAMLLKPGNSSADLPSVIAAIQKKGSEALRTEHAATFAAYQKTPDYTPELVDVVKSYQTEVGLKADGVIGNATLRKMAGHSAQEKIQKVIVAMEQARWLPADLGQRYVFINQAAFRVYYHEHGAEQFSMRAVVGAKAHQTFFFENMIQTVEFNPYWGVPQSIIVNEMLPKLRQDPSYLDRTGYEVAVNGKVMPSSQVNWFGSTQNISVRQPPSSDNALGDLKILFPNVHAIYMHDTPSKSFFQRDMRALSHGCVRLQEPRKMAAAVLGISQDQVDAEIAGGKNVAEKVTAKIPVYVAYFTAWPNKDGAIEYFDDVYDRDAATLKALDTTTKARSENI
ncbi:L,D-transpeptidase family protein [Neorhizobium sp. NCHU2750]|uniref:L,D-transpeptidase family protein n=1 Tax=Neorhizobium sp. NCHU2750 TaxID=1825976 RepID=UPI000E74C50C